MEIWMLILAAITAVAAVIAVLPILGFNVQIWKPKVDNLPKNAGMSKGKYWLLLAISSSALIVSGVGIFMHVTNAGIATDEQWAHPPDPKNLEPVRFKSFENEEVILDGKQIEDCNFKNVTLVFKGEKQFIFAHNVVNFGDGPIKLKVKGGSHLAAAELVQATVLDACRSNSTLKCPPVNLVPY